MTAQIVIALAVAIPVILFPAAFVWYLNFGGLYTAMKERRATGEKETGTLKVEAK